MGEIRLKLGPVEKVEEVIPLPDYWDELDTDEQRSYVNVEVIKFSQLHAHVTVEVVK